MNGNYLLDTNIVIALFARDRAVLERLSQESQIFVSNVVLGELYYGAEKSAQSTANIQRIDDLALATSTLSCNRETARYYGRIKEALRSKGRPIPENDLWIAAQALQHSLTVATRDDHFKEIDSISIERW